MTTPREQLVAALTPLLPQGWKFVPYQRTLDVFSEPTLMLKQDSIVAEPAAPQGAWTVSYILTLITPYTDPEKAEADLDDNVITLLELIEPVTAFKQAEKKMWSETGPACYDITFSYTTSKSKDES
jgi:hypothetical protein